MSKENCGDNLNQLVIHLNNHKARVSRDLKIWRSFHNDSVYRVANVDESKLRMTKVASGLARGQYQVKKKSKQQMIKVTSDSGRVYYKAKP